MATKKRSEDTARAAPFFFLQEDQAKYDMQPTIRRFHEINFRQFKHLDKVVEDSPTIKSFIEGCHLSKYTKIAGGEIDYALCAEYLKSYDKEANIGKITIFSKDRSIICKVPINAQLVEDALGVPIRRTSYAVHTSCEKVNEKWEKQVVTNDGVLFTGIKERELRLLAQTFHALFSSLRPNAYLNRIPKSLMEDILTGNITNQNLNDYLTRNLIDLVSKIKNLLGDAQVAGAKKRAEVTMNGGSALTAMLKYVTRSMKSRLTEPPSTDPKDTGETHAEDSSSDTGSPKEDESRTKRRNDRSAKQKQVSEPPTTSPKDVEDTLLESSSSDLDSSEENESRTKRRSTIDIQELKELKKAQKESRRLFIAEQEARLRKEKEDYMLSIRMSMEEQLRKERADLQQDFDTRLRTAEGELAGTSGKGKEKIAEVPSSLVATPQIFDLLKVQTELMQKLSEKVDTLEKKSIEEQTVVSTAKRPIEIQAEASSRPIKVSRVHESSLTLDGAYQELQEEKNRVTKELRETQQLLDEEKELRQEEKRRAANIIRELNETSEKLEETKAEQVKRIQDMLHELEPLQKKAGHVEALTIQLTQEKEKIRMMEKELHTTKQANAQLENSFKALQETIRKSLAITIESVGKEVKGEQLNKENLVHKLASDLITVTLERDKCQEQAAVVKHMWSSQQKLYFEAVSTATAPIEDDNVETLKTKLATAQATLNLNFSTTLPELEYHKAKENLLDLYKSQGYEDWALREMGLTSDTHSEDFSDLPEDTTPLDFAEMDWAEEEQLPSSSKGQAPQELTSHQHENELKRFFEPTPSHIIEVPIPQESVPIQEDADTGNEELAEKETRANTGFEFELPRSLKQVLTLKQIRSLIRTGRRGAKSFLEAQDLASYRAYFRDAKKWQANYNQNPTTVYGKQPVWRAIILQQNDVAWFAYCNTSPANRYNPAILPYPRRHGSKYDPSQHGEYNFPKIMNTRAKGGHDSYVFGVNDLIPSFKDFISQFTNCPEPAFIKTVNYLRVLVELMSLRHTETEDGLFPLYFDINQGIDPQAMIRLHLRAVFMPIYFLEILEDMVDTKFTACWHPFLPSTSFGHRRSLRDYFLSKSFLSQSKRPPQDPET